MLIIEGVSNRNGESLEILTGMKGKLKSPN